MLRPIQHHPNAEHGVTGLRSLDAIFHRLFLQWFSASNLKVRRLSSFQLEAKDILEDIVKNE